MGGWFYQGRFCYWTWRKGSVDLIYFDAFAPENNLKCGNDQLFKLLYVNMNKGGVLTTYCAKGMVRRMLQSVGFIVERLPGPSRENEKY